MRVEELKKLLKDTYNEGCKFGSESVFRMIKDGIQDLEDLYNGKKLKPLEGEKGNQDPDKGIVVRPEPEGKSPERRNK